MLFFFLVNHAFADLVWQPLSFVLSTDKVSYYEGEKITFFITITNQDKENSYPVLLPHTQNTGQKLFYLNLYDKAKNTLLLRATEDRMFHMMVHDTGTVQIKYLKPQEQIVIPVYLNDFENYYNYHTQNSSHHSFGVPLFAGIYKVNVCYNPNGIAMGDSIYSYYDFMARSFPAGKHGMPYSGLISNMIELKIRRSGANVISVERQKYYIQKESELYWYYVDSIGRGGSNERLVHLTNLPADSCSIAKGEYFYSHFTDIYAEYISRFDDGDIREYRKYSDYCPDYLYTEKYNDFKQKTHYALQLPDQRFYSITYGQPGNKIHQETYCSADGTLCNVTTYVYDKNGELRRKDVTQTQPCIEIEINGKKKSYKSGILELGE
jgi:hypothetical protein